MVGRVHGPCARRGDARAKPYAVQLEISTAAIASNRYGYSRAQGVGGAREAGVVLRAEVGDTSIMQT